MIKLRIKHSKIYDAEYNSFVRNDYDPTIYNIKDKELHFKGAQYLLNKLNGKTYRNIKTIANKLNMVWGYTVVIKYIV